MKAKKLTKNQREDFYKLISLRYHRGKLYDIRKLLDHMSDSTIVTQKQKDKLVNISNSIYNMLEEFLVVEERIKKKVGF